MTDNSTGTLHDSTDGGVAGKHPDASDFKLLAAPSTAKQSNTTHLRLVPVACWRVDDVRFAFDSSFVTPDIAKELQLLLDVRSAHSQKDPNGAMLFRRCQCLGTPIRWQRRLQQSA